MSQELLQTAIEAKVIEAASYNTYSSGRVFKLNILRADGTVDIHAEASRPFSYYGNSYIAVVKQPGGDEYRATQGSVSFYQLSE